MEGKARADRLGSGAGRNRSNLSLLAAGAELRAEQWRTSLGVENPLFAAGDVR